MSTMLIIENKIPKYPSDQFENGSIFTGPDEGMKLIKNSIDFHLQKYLKMSLV